VTASFLSVAPANAAVVGAEVNGGSVLHPVVVSIESHTEIVTSILGSSRRHILNVAGRRFAVVSDVNQDSVLNLRAFFPPRKLRAWLSPGPSHAQASSRPRRRRTHGSPLQHAFRFGPDRRTHGNAPTTQATSSGAVSLHDPPLGPATPASRFVVLPSSERIPFNERTGRRASRAPPLFTI
jgi:hypothetical protein